MGLLETLELLRDRLVALEPAIRLWLPWGMGGSRLRLWLSVAIGFVVFISVPAMIAGWIAGKVASWFLPKRFV